MREISWPDRQPPISIVQLALFLGVTGGVFLLGMGGATPGLLGTGGGACLLGRGGAWRLVGGRGGGGPRGAGLENASSEISS